MIDDFLLRSGLAALGVAVAAAPLGCVLVWRRMAFFGEATAHAALLGVAAGLMMGLPIFPMVLAASLALAIGVAALSRRGDSADLALGVLSHGALAVGLLAISSLRSVRVDLESFLMGDVLATGWRDVATVWIAVAVIFATAALTWRSILIVSLDRDLARAEGMNPERADLLLFGGLALFVAVAVEIVGVLLVVALLIIPAAAARALAATPGVMLRATVAIGAAAALGGLALAWWLDTPVGPTMASLAFLIFSLGALLARR